MSKTSTTTATEPKAKRVIDPGIAKIRDEAKRKVEEFRETQASERILKRILDDLLPRMTDADKATLRTNLEVPAVNPTKA